MRYKYLQIHRKLFVNLWTINENLNFELEQKIDDSAWQAPDDRTGNKWASAEGRSGLAYGRVQQVGRCLGTEWDGQDPCGGVQQGLTILRHGFSPGRKFCTPVFCIINHWLLPMCLFLQLILDILSNEEVCQKPARHQQARWNPDWPSVWW